MPFFSPFSSRHSGWSLCSPLEAMRQKPVLRGVGSEREAGSLKHPLRHNLPTSVFYERPLLSELLD